MGGNENIRSPERSSQGQSLIDPGPHLARVVRVEDNKYMGTLHVQLMRDVGNIPNSEGSTYPVKYLSPFYGITNPDHNGKNNTYNDTQKSYGMWMVPPTEGGFVVVIFINGDVSLGFWIGCVQDEYMNFMIPGVAATTLKVPFNGEKEPVAEYNRLLTAGEQPDSTQIKKPVHVFKNILETQGLLTDEFRGTTTSSARRESPSHVFGISTPGPVDRTNGAPRGVVGSKERPQTTFVSRLGGSTFVMDDGDDNYLRKTAAAEGPPEYVNVHDENGGQPSIPHNELVRIRTRTGHQILLHNSEDLIYIGNAKGTTWIELTSNGKIDIYAKDSVSVYSENDINFTAKRDINLTAETGNVNINADVNFNVTAGTNYEIKAGTDGKLTVGGQSNIKAGGDHVETAANIHMNGPAASPAQTAPKANRIPKHEPWPGHEHLNPTNFTPDKTLAKLTPDTPAEVLTKIIDTFKKIGK